MAEGIKSRVGTRSRDHVLSFVSAFVLIGLFCMSTVFALSPTFYSETEKFRAAVYETDRTIFTTYFVWYNATGNLDSAHQVIYDCNYQTVADIMNNLQNPPADWPGPTNATIDQLISFNATGNGHNYTEAISHHPPATPPTYNATGDVTSVLDRSLKKYTTDNNSIIVNLTSWFSYLNPVWHEWEMRCMMRAGIDVAMPNYWWTGPGLPGYGYFTRDGLVVLNDTITALQTTVAAEHAAGSSYTPDDVPRIAMFYDTTMMKQLWAFKEHLDPESIYFDNETEAMNNGPGPDLEDPYWENQFYLRIQEFYDFIINGSACHTVFIQNNGTLEEYCVVWLYSGGFFGGIGSHVLNYCKAHFEERYGKKLLFVGGGEWNQADVDGECGWGACCDVRLDKGTRIPVGGYGPGYYNIGTLLGQQARYIAHDTTRYKNGLQSAIDSGAAWLHLETWNELLEGTDICWTQEFGYDFIDATREIADRFHAMHGQPPITSRVNLVLVILPLASLVTLMGVAVILQRKRPVEKV
nr:hypothetical protein [Candidatus Sigynarchaeota archaeon]